MEGLFNSVLLYCLPVFGGLETGQLNKIQVLQNKAARLVLHAPPRAKRTEMFAKLEWFTINQLIHYHTLIGVFIFFYTEVYHRSEQSILRIH